ncbi:MAG: hypothetical protein NVSMB19_24400 [Vulcanimicrobiaceae bacterium]
MSYKYPSRVATSRFDLVRVVDACAIVLATVAAATISREVVEREPLGFDRAILLWLHGLGPGLNNVAGLLTWLGAGPAIAIVVAIAALLLIRHQAKRWAWGVVFVAVAASAIDYGLKALFGRARPELWSHTPTPGFSFPSGHSMESAAVYFFLVSAVGAVAPTRTVLAVFVVTLLVATIGLSRVILGVHWPSDVIGGVALGYLVQRVGSLWAARTS